MKTKTKTIIVASSVFFFTSCAALLNTMPPNCVKLPDYGEEMRVAKEVFPEIYNLYIQGQVEIKQIVYDTLKDEYHIQWRYRQTTNNY